MMERKEAVLSLSGVYEADGPCGWEDGIRVELTAVEGTTFVCEDAAADHLRHVIDGLPLSGIHWIDSGDYHYVSLFFLERIREPFTLVMCDHHSDMQESAFGADLLSCGSWLLQSLKRLPFLEQVILIGPEDDESMQAEESIRERVWWIREEELEESMEKINSRICGKKVYISFDKDILSEDFCDSGWSQGQMTLKTAVEFLDRIKEASDVIGIDFCGETPPKDGGFDPEGMRKNRMTNDSLRACLRDWMKGGEEA